MENNEKVYVKFTGLSETNDFSVCGYIGFRESWIGPKYKYIPTYFNYDNCTKKRNYMCKSCKKIYVFISLDCFHLSPFKRTK